ncbi:MAG TPA: response regulator [Syntrophorhabdaceae bacterium]|nr:response regulator [Syntrophorhabdaceae bacterium]
MNRQFKILVTDEVTEVGPGIFLLSTMLLKKAGYTVLQSSTGKECLNTVRVAHPDLVLVDQFLPDMTGAQVCREIKSNKDLEDIFVIVSTDTNAYVDPDMEMFELPADGYITKPISNREFLARIQASERIKRAEDALRQKEEENGAIRNRLYQALAEAKNLRDQTPLCTFCKQMQRARQSNDD